TNERVRIAGDRADDATSEVRRLRRDVDRLSLACLAMWQIVSANTNMTDEDLDRVMRELDASDGTLDGKLDAPDTPVKCRKCGRTALRGHPRCAYCGQEVTSGSASPFH
ncbi:MAG: hypothetical protein AB8G96_04585, partial [Phycisphaerales bacterium]